MKVFNSCPGSVRAKIPLVVAGAELIVLFSLVACRSQGPHCMCQTPRNTIIFLTWVPSGQPIARLNLPCSTPWGSKSASSPTQRLRLSSFTPRRCSLLRRRAYFSLHLRLLGTIGIVSENMVYCQATWNETKPTWNLSTLAQNIEQPISSYHIKSMNHLVAIIILIGDNFLDIILFSKNIK